MSVRRSGRKRQKTVKYTNDAFELLDLLSSGSEDNNQPPNEDDVADDHDFPVEETSDAPEAVDSSVGHGSDDNVSGSGENVSDNLSNGDDSAVDAVSDVEDTNPRVTKKRVATNPANPDKLHSRGVASSVFSSRYFKGSLSFSDPSVAAAGNRFRDELTLPSTSSKTNGNDVMSYNSNRDSGLQLNVEWIWCLQKDGQRAFTDAQIWEDLSPTAIDDYDSQANYVDREVLLGPQSHLSLLKVACGSAIDVYAAGFEKPSVVKDNFISQPNSKNRGWIINAGDSIQCLDWIPNKKTTQYLAVATRPKLKTDVGYSAFEPEKAATSTVQIWSLSSQRTDTNVRTIDMAHVPKVAMILYTEWGRIRHFSWCPFRIPEKHSAVMKTENRFGMLAMLHGDGKIRVVHVELPRSVNIPTQHKKLVAVAFESRPPETICTSLTWISPTIIAAGCANGYVAIWNLEHHLISPERPVNAEPFFYKPFHLSYITAICSCSPSQPDLLATVSMDGHVQLTSIKDSFADQIRNVRHRNGARAIAWHDHSQQILVMDDMYSVRGQSIRQFYHRYVITQESGVINSLATSPIHSSTLIGCSNGDVSVMNPIRKLRGHKDAGHYRQYWFKHTWRRGRIASNDPKDGSSKSIDVNEQEIIANPPNQDPSLHSKLDHPNGLSQILSGFSVEQFSTVFHYVPTNTKNKSPSAGPFSSIHEEETSINALSWNPNTEVGGWAAAGLGNGLVRVEDLCWDP